MTTEHKFKVGDRIKCKPSDEIGTIKNIIHEICLIVKFDDDPYHYYYHFSDIEKLPQEESNDQP